MKSLTLPAEQMMTVTPLMGGIFLIVAILTALSRAFLNASIAFSFIVLWCFTNLSTRYWSGLALTPFEPGFNPFEPGLTTFEPGSTRFEKGLHLPCFTWPWGFLLDLLEMTVLKINNYVSSVSLVTCIFWPVFGCCTPQMLVKIAIFFVFMQKSWKTLKK